MSLSPTRANYMEYLKNLAEEVAREAEAGFDSGKLTLPDSAAAFADTYQLLMGMLAQKLHERTETAADEALQSLPADVVKVVVSGFLKSEAGGAALNPVEDLAAGLPPCVLGMPNKAVARAWGTRVKKLRDEWVSSQREKITAEIRKACRGCTHKTVKVELHDPRRWEQRVHWNHEGNPALVVLHNWPEVPHFIDSYAGMNLNGFDFLRASVFETLMQDFERLGYDVHVVLDNINNWNTEPLKELTKQDFATRGTGFKICWNIWL
ncbi:unnamed protein product [Amoebophrya sp. A120]|nr:unnamed protein product [Amoebophrya sp. A120]|eukprot:GSA120T00003422001.1